MKKRLLVLDDDKDILEVMESALSYSNYEVKTEKSNENVFKIIDEYQPDLILLDYIFPTINGGETCHQIKSNPKTSDIPVVIISAYHRVLESLGTYGCDAILAKPFDLQDLLNVVENCMSKNLNKDLV